MAGMAVIAVISAMIKTAQMADMENRLLYCFLQAIQDIPVIFNRIPAGG